MLVSHSSVLEKRIENAEENLIKQSNKSRIKIMINNPELPSNFLKDSSPWEILEATIVGYSNTDSKREGLPTFDGTQDNSFSLYNIMDEIHKHTRTKFSCNKYSELFIKQILVNFEKMVTTLSKVVLYNELGIELYNAYVKDDWNDGYARTKRLTYRFVEYAKYSIRENFNEGGNSYSNISW